METLKDNDIHLACITESWLSPEQGHDHTLFVIQSYGFNISYTSRVDQRGGGVALLVKKGIKYTTLKLKNSIGPFLSFEWNGIRILGGKIMYRILCIYRKQEVSMETFIHELDVLALYFSYNTTDEMIVLGDFNVHFMTNDKSSCDLADLMSQYGLVQTVSESTRISGYTLDLIFHNPNDFLMEPVVSPDLIKSKSDAIKFDHYPILYNIMQSGGWSKESNFKPRIINYRNVKQINSEVMNTTLHSKLSNCMVSDSGNFCDKLEVFNSCLSSSLNELAPLRSKMITSPKEPLPEWMDAEYRSQRVLRRRLEKR